MALLTVGKLPVGRARRAGFHQQPAAARARGGGGGRSAWLRGVSGTRRR
ncbi:hypothetical protein ABLN97_15455 [Mycobacterium tuberculosis]